LGTGAAVGIKTTFLHYAPLFPTKREKGQLEKEIKSVYIAIKNPSAPNPPLWGGPD
jgi:hypothetical protein